MNQFETQTAPDAATSFVTPEAEMSAPAKPKSARAAAKIAKATPRKSAAPGLPSLPSTDADVAEMIAGEPAAPIAKTRKPKAPVADKPAEAAPVAVKPKSPKAAARAAVAAQMPEKLAAVADVVEVETSEVEDEIEVAAPVAEIQAEPEKVGTTPVMALAEGEDATSFHQLPLSPPMLAVLDEKGFTTPTPIQARAIPIVATGADLLGIAQTGTGKTLAFGLPIMERIFSGQSKGRALMLLPTRELALQVEDALSNIGRQFRLRTAVLIGGAPVRPQLTQLRNNPDIIVATPGRLNDYLTNGDVDLRAVDTVVLDEADRMLDMGFAPQIRRILDQVPEDRQTLLFSATMPDEIVGLTKQYMRDPQRIEIERPGTGAQNIEQRLYVVEQDDKTALLERLLHEVEGSVLVFARTRSRANKVARFVSNIGIRSAEIHSDRSLVQRRQALDGFKAGHYRVLVATDIAARGIDVTGIEMVVQFDLPDSPDDYVHRIGRTARAGRSGIATSFAAPEQWRDVRDIEKLTGQPLPFAADNEGKFPMAATHAARSGGNRSGGGGGNRNRTFGGNRGGGRPQRGR